MKKILLLYILLPLLYIQCTEDGPVDPGTPGKGTDESTIKEFGDANSTFAFDLFQAALSDGDEEGENMIISPLSVHTALLLGLNGANNDTYAAMARTLHSDDYSEASINKSFEAYHDFVESRSNSELMLANAVFWDDTRLDLNDGYSERLLDHYKAEFDGLSFREEEALETINTWVSDKTNGRIPKILDQINSEEVAFLINALYFKGDWANPFPIESTFDRPFVYTDGHTNSVPMMSHDALLSHYIDTELQAADLFFADSAFSMTFIQPSSEGTSIRDFAKSFDLTMLNDLYTSQLAVGRVQLFLPKFEADYSINMSSALKSMGMEIAFDQMRADLSRLGNAPEGNLFISRVEHKTFLSVDEKGAEGAAVTSVGIGVTSAPPVIDFNRPFMIVLRDVQYNSIVFLGLIENPEVD